MLYEFTPKRLTEINLKQKEYKYTIGIVLHDPNTTIQSNAINRC